MKLHRGAVAGGVVAALLLAAGWGVKHGLYPFLARQAPVPADILVIEGWVVDDLLQKAAFWARSNGVRRIIATGGPVELGSHLSEWKTYAEMSRARLEKMGWAEHFELEAVPTEKVRRGRTRASAQALRRAWRGEFRPFNLASEGPHTRRSWEAFQQAFEGATIVGSVALPPADYDGQDWWRCSEGVRAVLGETIAWLADLWFAEPPHPPPP